MAQGYLKQYTEAETNFNSAFAVLQARITNVKKMEASAHIDEEVADLESLICEIQGKIQGHKDAAVVKMEIAGSGDCASGKIVSTT